MKFKQERLLYYKPVGFAFDDGTRNYELIIEKWSYWGTRKRTIVATMQLPIKNNLGNLINVWR